MELDFSKLLSLDNEATESPQNDGKGVNNTIAPLEREKPLELNVERLKGIEEKLEEKAPPKRYLSIESDKKLMDQRREAVKITQDNIKASERIRAEINKAIYAGEETHSILLKALECISLMTGEKLFYESNKEKLKKIYGALGCKPAIEQEMQEVSKRLETLRQAPEDSNIRTAIKMHEQKLESLRALE